MGFNGTSFGAFSFPARRIPLAFLGQEEEEPPAETPPPEEALIEPLEPPPTITIDRTVAQGAVAAIKFLREAPTEFPNIATEACWRDVMVRHRQEIEELEVRLHGFLGSGQSGIEIPETVYEVLEKALDCVSEITQEEEAETLGNIEVWATILGIVGGVIALVEIF